MPDNINGTVLILTASIYNLDNPIPDCQTILNFAAARDNGGSSVDNWNTKMCKAL